MPEPDFDSTDVTDQNMDTILETLRKAAPNKKPDKRQEKITSRDIPRLMEMLSCGDPHEQQETLRLLCPCRNARYDREVWRDIFRVREESDAPHVRDQAGHAIQTLFENARTDPRSQELLQWLASEGMDVPPLENLIPEWRPGGRAGLNGLYIPRYERSPRSKANRRR